MGLRLKLLIPTLIGFIAFAAILNFYWAPNHEQKLSEQFKTTQATFLKTIEPELLRDLISSDYAALINFLDQQMVIHHDSWRHLHLTLANGDTIYPVFDEEAYEDNSLILLTSDIHDGKETIASFRVWLDWSEQLQNIKRDTRQIQTLMLAILAFIIAAGTFWQNHLIITPLLRLKNAVKKPGNLH